MADFTLADIQAAADAKFGDCRIALGGNEEVILRNGLRMPKEERRELTGLQKRLDALQSDDEEIQQSELMPDEDQADAMTRLIRDILSLVAADKATVTTMLSRIGDDLPTLLQVLTEYGQVAQPGEASPSPS